MFNFKTYTTGELDEILRKHSLWTNHDPSGERADLRGANLRGANLYGVDLREADLRGANLRGANLREADLRGANLYEADLRGANLRGANLYGVDLREANLREANLYGANLRGANLYGVDLREANLREANLREANLYGANLRGVDLYGVDLYGVDLREANLYGANLRGANLYEAKNINFPIACPEEGSFIGFKKCAGNYIVKLEIPKDAFRCSAIGRKCRCSKAIVLSITNIDGSDSETTEVRSIHDPNFTYKIGEIVSVDDFEMDRWKECASGIHFFITRQEAVNY